MPHCAKIFIYFVADKLEARLHDSEARTRSDYVSNGQKSLLVNIFYRYFAFQRPSFLTSNVNVVVILLALQYRSSVLKVLMFFSTLFQRKERVSIRHSKYSALWARHPIISYS